MLKLIKKRLQFKVLCFIVSSLEETLQSLNVESSCSQAVRMRGQRFGVDVFNKFIKIPFAFHS